jgi:alpha-L-fucosidase
MPNGMIQQEFRDSLAGVGAWLKQYGESIYGTRGNVVAPQPWGVVTAKNKTLFAHVLTPNNQPYIFVPEVKATVTKARIMGSNTAIKFRQMPEGLFVYINAADAVPVDTIIQLETK